MKRILLPISIICILFAACAKLPVQSGDTATPTLPVTPAPTAALQESPTPPGIVSEPNTVLDDITVTAILYTPNTNTVIRYPELTAENNKYALNRINAELREEAFDEADDDWRSRDYKMDYTVYRIGDVLVAELSGYVYTGGAHGMPFLETMHFDLISGDDFDLEDLFTKGSRYESALADIMWQDIESGNVRVWDTTKKSDLECDNFRLKDDHIEIYFEPYELSSFADGFVTFEIPYTKIDSIIDKNGVLYNRMSNSKGE